LYRHFPGKADLYKEILRYGVDISVVSTDELDKLEPGAETLAACVYLVMKLILTDVPQNEEAQHWHEKLLFQSLIDDQTYARSHFKNLIENLEDPLRRHMESAEKAGDLVR
jgi:AcrR family transcriptional regulator